MIKIKIQEKIKQVRETHTKLVMSKRVKIYGETAYEGVEIGIDNDKVQNFGFANGSNGSKPNSGKESSDERDSLEADGKRERLATIEVKMDETNNESELKILQNELASPVTVQSKDQPDGRDLLPKLLKSESFDSNFLTQDDNGSKNKKSYGRLKTDPCYDSPLLENSPDYYETASEREFQQIEQAIISESTASPLQPLQKSRSKMFKNDSIDRKLKTFQENASDSLNESYPQDPPKPIPSESFCSQNPPESPHQKKDTEVNLSEIQDLTPKDFEDDKLATLWNDIKDFENFGWEMPTPEGLEEIEEKDLVNKGEQNTDIEDNSGVGILDKGKNSKKEILEKFFEDGSGVKFGKGLVGGGGGGKIERKVEGLADVVVIKESGRKKNRFIKFGKGRDERRGTDGKYRKGESGGSEKRFGSNGPGTKNEIVGDLCESPVKSDASLEKKSDRVSSQGSPEQPSPEKLHCLEKSAQPEAPPFLPEPSRRLTPDVEPQPTPPQNLKSSFITVDSDRLSIELDSPTPHNPPQPTSQTPTPTNNPLHNNNNLTNFSLLKPKPTHSSAPRHPTQETLFSDKSGNIITCKIGDMIEKSDSEDYDDLPMGPADESQEFCGQIIDSQAEIQGVPVGCRGGNDRDDADDGVGRYAMLAGGGVVSSPLRSDVEDEELTLWNQKIPEKVGSGDGGGSGSGSGDGEVNFMETGEFGEKLQEMKDGNIQAEFLRQSMDTIGEPVQVDSRNLSEGYRSEPLPIVTASESRESQRTDPKEDFLAHLTSDESPQPNSLANSNEFVITEPSKPDFSFDESCSYPISVRDDINLLTCESAKNPQPLPQIPESSRSRINLAQIYMKKKNLPATNSERKTPSSPPKNFEKKTTDFIIESHKHKNPEPESPSHLLTSESQETSIGELDKQIRELEAYTKGKKFDLALQQKSSQKLRVSHNKDQANRRRVPTVIQSSARLRTSYSTRLNTNRGSVGDGSGGKEKSGQDMVKSFIDEKLLLLNRQKEALKSERESFYEEKNEILSVRTKLESDRQKFEVFKERELSKLEKSKKEFKKDKG